MVNSKTRNMTAIGVLAAIAFAVVALGRVPLVLFLKYDPKDIVIVIGGFIWGPMTAFFVSLVVSFIEMFTISDTGIFGFIMNVLSSCTFACTAAVIYKRKHTMQGALQGLVTGWLLTVLVMMLWNYLITPFYMGYPREAVVKLLLPAFLPFNLIKGGLNTALTLMLYKPIVMGLRKAHLIPKLEQPQRGSFHLGLFSVASLILISCVLLVLVIRGIL